MKKYISVVVLTNENLNTGIKNYEETFLQVDANDIDQAIKFSEEYGKSCETIYKNNLGEELKISFNKVVDTNPVLREEAENNVTELYSRSYEKYNL